MTANRSERAANGALQAWVHHESSRVLFRQCADIVVEQFGAEGRDRLDGGDQVFWDYVASELPFTLYLERGLGISVIAGEPTAACEALVRRIPRKFWRAGSDVTPAPVPAWLVALLADHRASHAPHYSPAGLSDHGPMAYLALHGLGLGQHEIERFARAYRPRLAPLPSATEEFGVSDVRDHFGRLDAYPSFLRFFDAEVSAHGTAGAVSRYLPELISGWVTDAFHALIRLSYGVEFGVASEVAAGLAYLAGVGENAALARAAGLPVAATEGRDYLLALGAYRGAKTAVAPQPFNERYREVLETVDVRPSGGAATTLRPKLERACLDVFHETHDFFALHLVTASHAFRVCAPFAGPDADRIFSVGIAAAYLAIGAPDFRPVVSSEGGLPLDRLATATDEHDIKIAYTALASARAYSDPTYEWVASRYLEGRLG